MPSRSVRSSERHSARLVDALPPPEIGAPLRRRRARRGVRGAGRCPTLPLAPVITMRMKCLAVFGSDPSRLQISATLVGRAGSIRPGSLAVFSAACLVPVGWSVSRGSRVLWLWGVRWFRGWRLSRFWWPCGLLGFRVVGQRVGGDLDAHPPARVYLPDAPLVAAISTSAVAWMSASSSLSRPGENSSRRSGAMVIGKPSGMTAVLSSVPSLDGEAPR